MEQTSALWTGATHGVVVFLAQLAPMRQPLVVEALVSNGYGSKLGTPIIGWLILN